MNKLLLGLIVLVLGAMAGWYLLSGGKQLQLPKPPAVAKLSPTPVTPNLLRATGAEDVVPTVGAEKGGVNARSVVTYTDTGFSPATISVPVGTTVTFVNESSQGMWVASAVHPTHKVLPGFDQLKSVTKSGTYEYIFAREGTWNYHNHVVPAYSGTVVVTK